MPTSSWLVPTRNYSLLNLLMYILITSFHHRISCLIFWNISVTDRTTCKYIYNYIVFNCIIMIEQEQFPTWSLFAKRLKYCVTSFSICEFVWFISTAFSARRKKIVFPYFLESIIDEIGHPWYIFFHCWVLWSFMLQFIDIWIYMTMSNTFQAWCGLHHSKYHSSYRGF